MQISGTAIRSYDTYGAFKRGDSIYCLVGHLGTLTSLADLSERIVQPLIRNKDGMAAGNLGKDISAIWREHKIEIIIGIVVTGIVITAAIMIMIKMPSTSDRSNNALPMMPGCTPCPVNTEDDEGTI